MIGADPGIADPGPSDPGPVDPGAQDPGPKDPGGQDPGTGFDALAVQCGTGDSQFPEFDKNCTADGDCALVFHTVNCCGTEVALGINAGQVAAFDAAEAICDSPAGCVGHRMDGYCNDAHVCKAQQMADPAGCTGSQCFNGNYCVGAAVHQHRCCDAGGGCTAHGVQLQNCQGINACCYYWCDGGVCGSAFKGTIECAYLCYLNPLVCVCFRPSSELFERRVHGPSPRSMARQGKDQRGIITKIGRV